MGAARVVVVVVVSTLLEHQLGDLCCATRVAERVLRVPVHVVRVLRATIIRVDFTGIPCAQFRRALLRALRKYVSLVLFFWLEAGGWRHNTGAARVGWRPEDGDTIQVLRAYRAMRKRGFHSNILAQDSRKENLACMEY